MYGSVKGIAGNSIDSVKTLELSGAEETESDEDQIEEESGKLF